MSLARRLVLGFVALVVAATAATAVVLWQQGYRVYVVHTGSMVPTYVPGDLVVDRPATGHYRPGEVITFRYSAASSDLVTHRVAAITPAGLIRTKGDANRTADAWRIPPSRVQGTAWLRLKDLGYVTVYFRQPAAVASLVTITLAIVCLWGVFFAPEDAGEADGARGEPRIGSHRRAKRAAASCPV